MTNKRRGIEAALTRGAALISPCGQYRYWLTRRWSEGPCVVFVGLNPSTADASVDDPTIRRCIAFAKAWGCGSLAMVNLFAFRATQPADMFAAADPIGPDNDTWIRTASASALGTVEAWGAHGGFLGRDVRVRELLQRRHYLRLTKDGHPGHPLYLPGYITPMPYD